MKTIYEKAKPRHIVNGQAFKSFILAQDYIEKSGFELERIEKIMNITIYYVKEKIT